MTKTLLIGLFMTFLSGHLLASSNFNKTNLGDNGNSYVLDQHRRFLGSYSKCQPKSDDHFRVIIQGFSLFTGIKKNISGAVVDTFSKVPFTERSLLGPNDFGSRVTQEVIEIEGKTIELCLVVSEVLWDLAAANLIAIANDFKPDLIIMSGLGGKKSVIETGGRNTSGLLAGYRYNGNYEGRLNKPRSKRIDPRYKSSKTIQSTWNFETIHKALSPMIKDLGFEVNLGVEGRVDNSYICNNIHYSLLQASTESNIELAGGLLRPSLNMDSIPAMGFFHYPKVDLTKNGEEKLEQWSLVIKQLIRSQLNL